MARESKGWGDMDDAFEAEVRSAEAEMQLVVWVAAGFFVAMAVGASVVLIRGHLAHFSRPIVQSKVRFVVKCSVGATCGGRGTNRSADSQRIRPRRLSGSCGWYRSTRQTRGCRCVSRCAHNFRL